MTNIDPKNKVCAVIGASHGGVNFAFALRKEGWEGDIVLIDADPITPYHRPPLSKAYLTSGDGIEKNLLKAPEAYEKANIRLKLGVSVNSVDREAKQLSLSDKTVQQYDKLVFASGASPIVPPIPGIDKAESLFVLRTAGDVDQIRESLQNKENAQVVVIGGGYIGLETAASLKKLGASVTVLEREERILQRVTTEYMSNFFQTLHSDNGVDICTQANVSSFEFVDGQQVVKCADGSQYPADIIIVGVGVRVNTELAEEIGLDLENGIKVDESACTNDENIFAIGDCSFHFNPHYERFIRLESVQNAVDQAKVAAAAICDKPVKYDTIPWFWSDQYDVKLQMVGLSQGFDQSIVRKEVDGENKFSVWYFKGEELLAVDAINNAKAYVIGTKFIKASTKVNKAKLENPETLLKPDELI